MDKYQLLRRLFGYDSFRTGQEDLIDGVLSGQDVFGIMPTGGGKSMCYQIPGVMLPGITLVISPLISLMHDQVMALKAVGIPAAYINSTLSAAQIRLVYRNLLSGMYKIVYVAPERLDYPGFQGVASQLRISFIAVDEAHCISQWGQDFRPSYLRIVDFIQELPYRPAVGAYTATATEQVRQDVERILELRNPVRVVTGFDRPNLNFEVMKPGSKDQELLRLLAARKRKSGIIYCSTRKTVENVCELLLDKGYSATRYHAGLEEEERTHNQEDFIHDRSPVMVATNAFGMGIDKSNVSFVIHYNMPKSIEAYYQEAGRAGRDGSPSDCILLFGEKDVQTARFLIEQNSDNESLTPEQQRSVRQQDLERLSAMVEYCKTRNCLRAYILDYFGQKHTSGCGNCSNCRGEYVSVDITREARMILKCVAEIEGKLGYTLGSATVAKVLQGSREKRILELELKELSAYGCFKDLGRTKIREMIDHLEFEGYLLTNPEHQGLMLQETAMQVIAEKQKVLMLQQKEEEETVRITTGKRSTVPEDPELFEVLRNLRAKLAKEAGVPPYVVFSNATLTEMAAQKPRTNTEFRAISGVGELKAGWYAKPFLQTIRKYLEETE